MAKKKAPVEEVEDLDDELEGLDDLDDEDEDTDSEEDTEDEDESEDEEDEDDEDEDEDEEESPPKSRKGKKKGTTKKRKPRADGQVGTAELAAAIGTDGRNLRVMLRDKGLTAEKFEGGRYVWPSVEAALKQLGFKNMKAAQAALQESRDSRLKALKESQAEKRAAKGEKKGKGKKKKSKSSDEDE